MSDISDKTVRMTAEMSVVLWRALREEGRNEADLLAAAIIASGFEPLFEDSAEAVDFYREWMIVEGLIHETPPSLN